MDTLYETSFLTTRELAKKLSVPINTVYFWISKNEIPYIKIGKHNRFNYEEVMAFFRNKTTKRKQQREVN